MESYQQALENNFYISNEIANVKYDSKFFLSCDFRICALTQEGRM